MPDLADMLLKRATSWRDKTKHAMQTLPAHYLSTTSDIRTWQEEMVRHYACVASQAATLGDSVADGYASPNCSFVAASPAALKMHQVRMRQEQRQSRTNPSGMSLEPNMVQTAFQPVSPVSELLCLLLSPQQGVAPTASLVCRRPLYFPQD